MEKGFIRVHKGLIKKVGINAAIVYGELVSLFEYWKKRGELTEQNGRMWFYCTIEDLEEKTTLKRDAQDKAIAKLVAEGLIEVQRFGHRARRYFYVDTMYVEMLFGKDEECADTEIQIAEKSQTKTDLDCGKTAVSNNNKEIDSNKNKNKKNNNKNLSINEIKPEPLRELLAKQVDRLTDDKVSVVKNLADIYLPLFEAAGLNEVNFAHVVIRCLMYPTMNFRHYLRKALDAELTKTRTVQSEKRTTVRKEPTPEWFDFNEYVKHLNQQQVQSQPKAEPMPKFTLDDLRRMKRGEIPFDERVNHIQHIKKLYESIAV
jgi:DNA-binding MarR family transcriptional regulator